MAWRHPSRKTRRNGGPILAVGVGVGVPFASFATLALNDRWMVWRLLWAQAGRVGHLGPFYAVFGVFLREIRSADPLFGVEKADFLIKKCHVFVKKCHVFPVVGSIGFMKNFPQSRNKYAED